MAALLVASLAAGCGSTVQLDSQKQTTAEQGLGRAPGQPDGVDPGPGFGLDVGAAAPGTGPAAGPGVVGSTASSVASGGTTEPGRGPTTVRGERAESGRGFTGTTIDIGFPESDDPSPYLSALGFKDIEVGDPKAQILAVVNDINRRGGLAGRQIKPVFHMFSTAQVLSDPHTANEAACVDWTQDHHVYAVVNPGALIYDDGLFACMAKTKTPLLLAGGQDAAALFSSTYAKYPLVFNLGGITRDHYLDVSIRRYVERKFFTGWDTVNGRPGTAAVKMGLLYTDSPLGRVDLQYMKGQLARYGLRPDAEIGCPASLQEKTQCQQSAVLRMRSDGVTHIIGAGLTFMQQADSQSYRPRYIIPIQPKTLEDNAPKTQLAGSMYEGWIPAMETQQAYSPGDPSPATAYCRKVMKAAGQNVSGYGLALWQMETICDAGYFLEAAVKANPVLTPDDLRVGFEALGSSVPSALTFATLLNGGRHASANAVRDLAFVPNSCSDCNDGHFAYVSRRNYTS